MNNNSQEQQKAASIAFAEWFMANIFADTNCRSTDELYDIFKDKVYIPKPQTNPNVK